MWKKIGNILFSSLFIIGLLSVPKVSCGQDVEFDASVNTRRVTLGSAVQLTLTIKGKQGGSAIELPPIEGFEARYVGPSTRVSIINGQYSSSVAYMYQLFALKVGTFEIPPISITLDGKTYTSEPIQIEVVKSDSNLADQQQPAGQQETGIEDKIFAVMETPQKEVFLNQKVPVTIKLYINQLSVRDIQFPELEATGFTVEEYGQPKQYSQVLGGVSYNVVEFNTSIFPTRTGELKVGPARISCNILFKASGQRASPFGGFDSFFDDDFFSGFFGGYEKYPINIESVDLTLNVLTWPETNRPEDFSGAVGDFDFRFNASPSEVKVGDPITVRMVISGEGNLKTAKFPQLQDSQDFKVYEPEITAESNEKRLEQVLIPRSDNVKEISALQFSYFKPQKKEYVTIKRGPIAVRVQPSTGQPDFRVIELPQKEGIVYKEEIGKDILFIKDSPGQLRKANRYLYRSGWFLFAVVCSIIVFVALCVFSLRKERLKSDIVYARRLHAPRKAKKGIEESKRLMQEGRQKEFYDRLSKTLQEYLGDKFHLTAGTLNPQTMRRLADEGRMDDGMWQRIKHVMDECDAIRFSPVGADKERMKTSFEEVREIIDYLERH